MATTAQMSVDANTIALYHLDGTAGTAAKVDNAEGTASRDLTENSSPPSGTGVIVPTADGCYDFDGSTDYLSTADDAAFDGLSNFSLEFWFNADATDDDRQPVTKWGATTATNQSWRVITAGSKITLQIGNGTTSGSITPSSTFSTGTWYYVAFTYNSGASAGSRGKVYINGVDVTSSDTTPSSMLAGSAEFRIGTRDGGPGAAAYWNGRVDEVRLSNSTRSAAEIDAYYNPVAAGGNAFFMGANF